MEKFRFIPTPNPQEMAFMVQVRADLLRSHNLPAPLTPYKLCPHVEGKRMGEGWDDYVYLEPTIYPPQPDEGFLWFIFGKPRTEEERNTPFRTRPIRFGNHPWPGVLKGIRYERDSSFPLCTEGPNGELIFSDRHYLRLSMISAASGGSTFVLEEFLSDRPFNLGRYPVPLGELVQGDYLDSSFSIDNVIHDNLEIEDMVTGSRVRVPENPDASGSGGGVLKGQYFPRTNFTDWRPHFIADEQEIVNGLHYRQRVMVHPPRRPRVRTQRG